MSNLDAEIHRYGRKTHDPGRNEWRDRPDISDANNACSAPGGFENCWKKLETTRVSGNFPRRYYPDRVQRVSLSLVAWPVVSFRAP
jgi:hypothetical protein